MQKGQISIDLLFTLVAVLMIIFTFSSLTNSTYLMHNNLNTKLQLDMETDKITNIITQTQMIGETTYKINFSLNKITYLDSNNNQLSQHPNAVIENDLLKLSISTDTETIESTRRFSKNQNTTITIGTEGEKGNIVIEHA